MPVIAATLEAEAGGCEFEAQEWKGSIMKYRANACIVQILMVNIASIAGDCARKGFMLMPSLRLQSEREGLILVSFC